MSGFALQYVQLSAQAHLLILAAPTLAVTLPLQFAQVQLAQPRRSILALALLR